MVHCVVWRAYAVVWGRPEDSTRLERLKEATAVDQLPKESLDQLERVVLDERIDLFEEVVEQAAEVVAAEQIGDPRAPVIFLYLKPDVHLLEDAANRGPAIQVVVAAAAAKVLDDGDLLLEAAVLDLGDPAALLLEEVRLGWWRDRRLHHRERGPGCPPECL